MTETGNNAICYVCAPTTSSNSWTATGEVANVTYTWPSFSRYDTATVNWDFSQLYNAGYNLLYNNFMNAYGTGDIVTIWYGMNSVGETEEERAARVAREQQRVEAQTKAEELLLACLTDEQRESYLKDGYIDTNVKDKTYRIEKVGGVYLLEKEIKKASFCIHPTDFRLPRQDVMLSQLLLLNADEDQFLKTANRTILHQ